MKLPVNYTKLTPKEKREVREEYIKIQGGKCMWCGDDIYGTPPEKILNKEINWRNFPKGFLANPIHLQHDHHTLLTEGAVHAYCNAVMWQYHNR